MVNGFFGLPLLGLKMLKIYIGLFILSAFNSLPRQVLRFFWKNINWDKVKIPVLVIHSKDDKVVSYLQSKSFYSKAGSSNKTYKQLCNIDHGLSVDGAAEDVVEIIKHWLTHID